MAELSKNYKKIISEIEENIKEPQEREFVKCKVSELAIMFMDTIEKIIESSDKQLKLERRINNLENSMQKIEDDIYIEDEEDDNSEEYEGCLGCNVCEDKMNDSDYEFEILCPYCKSEFVTGKDTDLESEIECPNCHNVIELDWEEYCDGECNECNNHCYHEEPEKEVIGVQEEQNNNYNYTSGKIEENQEKNNQNENNNQNEDDM